jgi:hypothetical protein
LNSKTKANIIIANAERIFCLGKIVVLLNNWVGENLNIRKKIQNKTLNFNI